MPNPGAGPRWEQWESCERCGRPYPMSQLVYQEGLLVCTVRCRDTKTVNQWERELAEALYPDEGGEGVDQRFVDRSFDPGGEW